MLSNSIAVLARMVVPEPGFIVGPIARVFGVVIDFLFNIVWGAFGPAHSLGLTIVLMTIIVRFLMMPLMLKSQRAMIKMREIKPELDKIQEKYGKSKDPEIMRKMNAERTALMAKHGANPLSGCLPILLTMPLFIGLNFIIRQAFLYITRLREVYYELSQSLIDVTPLLAEGGRLRIMGNTFIPQNIHENNAELAQILWGKGWEVTEEQITLAREQVGETLLMGRPEELTRVINRFNMEEWSGLIDYIEYMQYIPALALENIVSLVHQIQSIETFFRLHVVHAGGFAWPGIMIPVLVLISSFVSSWLMQKRTMDPNADDKVKMQQKIMLYAMPVVMAAFTFGLPAGVGIFWITSQIFQAMQDYVMFKRDGIKLEIPFLSKKESGG